MVNQRQILDNFTNVGKTKSSQKTYHPFVDILMYWFHVTNNVRKSIHLIVQNSENTNKYPNNVLNISLKAQAKDDIYVMHYTLI